MSSNMSNNFLNLDNTAGASAKSPTEALLSLLQLNTLLGGGNTANGGGVGNGLVGAHGVASLNGLNGLAGLHQGGNVGVGPGALPLFGNSGLNGLNGLNGVGGGLAQMANALGALNKPQGFQQPPTMTAQQHSQHQGVHMTKSQHHQSQHQPWNSNGMVGSGGIGMGNYNGPNTASVHHQPPPKMTGRAITNTGNLANNHHSNHHYNSSHGSHQQHHHHSSSAQQPSQPDIFSQAGKMNDAGDFKINGGHRHVDNSILKASYRNGGETANGTNSYNNDFGEFTARDSYFGGSVQSNSSGSHNSSGMPNGGRHLSAGASSSIGVGSSSSSNNHGFPPIGTFSVETASSSSASSSINQMYVGGGNSVNIALAPQVPDIFATAAQANLLNGGSSGGGGGSSSSSQNYSSGNNNSGGDPNQATRETGIIEKLLQHSYGFIQCCERQARLFFHFSQFTGNIEHLKIGDPVEFEMTYDRRTGKPIASNVTKIAPEVVLSEERVTGTVTTELKSDNSTTSTGGETTTGRISYENRGECFFLPYNKDDVEGNVTLCAGDKVSFQIATNARGNLGACHIRLENPVHPVKYRGVVCTMKESFGFIERADVVKEIFFHFSEAEGSVELRPGDDVEFTIQTRNVSNNLDLLQGKEVACNITRLPPGSVVFEDIATTIYKGQVLKPLERNNQARQNNDPLPGRIRYRAADHSEVEVPFGDKDQKGEFTLRHGDWVQFLLATDRRDQLQRATAISLLDETFEVSGERREQGLVAALKAEFGFLLCVDRKVRLFFHLTEVLDTAREICVGDEVEFTAVQDPGSSFANNRLSAIRIKHLPPGTVQFETLVIQNIEGVVTREAPKSPIKSTERMEGGVITYTQAAAKKTIMYFLKDCEKPPRVGDQVRFDICLVKRNKEFIAVNIVDMQTTSTHVLQQQQQQQQLQHQQDIEQQHSLLKSSEDSQLAVSSPAHNKAVPSPTHHEASNNNGAVADSNGMDATNGPVYYGYIAVLKESFGFIETLQHDKEVFFHFSNFVDGPPGNLELGNEVEYTLSKRSIGNLGNCLPAENVKLAPRGSIAQPKIIGEILCGIVVRPLRCINPDQTQYSGLVQVMDETTGEPGTQHEFGITSLVNKRDLLQKDDCVTFRVDENSRAAELSAVRKKKRANVNSIKGLFGFLDYEVDKDKKLFFHMSEVQGNPNGLHAGDTVEFSVVTNQVSKRNGKTSACNVVKVLDNVASRPERMLTRLKINSIDDTVPRVIAIRQPKGPEGIGFGLMSRVPRLPGRIYTY